MGNNYQRLSELFEEYFAIINCRNRINSIEKEVRELEQRLKNLELNVEEKYQNVNKINFPSINNLFASILKNKSAQQEEQNQAYLLAILEYNECDELVATLNYEKEVLKEKIKNGDNILRKIESEITVMDNEMIEKSSPYVEEYKTLTLDLKKLFQLKIEVHEALTVAKDLGTSIHQLLKSLELSNKFDNWGSYYHEKQEAKKKKEFYIDKAQIEVQLIHKLLVHLSSELNDVKEAQNEFRRSELLVRKFNINYYHSLISDWVEQNSLKNSTSEVHSTDKIIQSIINSLSALLENALEELSLANQRREELIEKFVSY